MFKISYQIKWNQINGLNISFNNMFTFLNLMQLIINYENVNLRTWKNSILFFLIISSI